MNKIYTGRYTTRTAQPFVVFLIGMRINRLWAVSKWWPVMLAMPSMIRDLMRNPEKGFLGGRLLIEWRGVTMIHYWCSFDDLERFARNSDDLHLPAWKMFYQRIGKGGSIAIWHETYQVSGNESMYVNMPRHGLGQVMELVPASGQRQSARGRLGVLEQASAEKETANHVKSEP